MIITEQVLKVSKFFEDRMNAVPERVFAYDGRLGLDFYTPEGYENWTIKEYGDDQFSKFVVMISEDNKLVLAPRKELGYIKEMLDDMILIWIG